jgi:glycosyltransferase involved in cell wall biosynthesis
MRVNWVGYYVDWDGYGRFSSRLVRALQEFGLDVLPLTDDDLGKPSWMLRQAGISWDDFTITCNLPKMVKKLPGNGKHWFYTMCESSRISKASVKYIHRSGVERVLVPCQHNKEAFERSGVKTPISVVPLGTDPDEFSMAVPDFQRPYTFLTLADRGTRKGWQEVYNAFYRAFGGKTKGIQDVRLIIKCTPNGNPLLRLITKAEEMDHRIKIDMSIYPQMNEFFKQGDCLALPSRCEGWGLPHREAAMMGLPVLTQKYAGLDDGHTDDWSLVVHGGKIYPIAPAKRGQVGEWMIANENLLSEAMRFCYDEPDKAEHIGKNARGWLCAHQTWQDAAAGLIELIHDQGVYYGEAVRRIRRESRIFDQNGIHYGTISTSNLQVG